MNITSFFIKRPVLSIVLNVLILVVGLLSYNGLSLREYPKVSVPNLTIDTFYLNAAQDVVENEITYPLEDVLAGIEGLDKIESQTKYSHSTIYLKFKPGVNIDTILSTIRDKISLVKFPKDAYEPTIRRESEDNKSILYISAVSKELSQPELKHKVIKSLKNYLRSIPGVSSADVIGMSYIMNIQLDRVKMFKYKISPDQIKNILIKNNVKVPAGKFMGQIPVTVDVALDDVVDFENLIVKKNNLEVVLLKDIATVSLDADDSFRVKVGKQPGVIIGVKKTEESNPLIIADKIYEILPKVQSQIGSDIKLEVDYDSTLFIKASLKSIAKTIIEAVFLVSLIIIIFLGSIRATVIPLLAIPISLIGSVALLKWFGFSINTLTLLASVLAVGLVVDDAIVVLENIYRYIEKGLKPLEAAFKGSKEIGFAIIAMTFTLASVYLPLAFVGGMVGKLFLEFAVALSGAVIASGITALTLSPVMCSKLLKEKKQDKVSTFDKILNKAINIYEFILSLLLRNKVVVVVITLLIALSGVYLFKSLPKSLAVNEDRGYFYVWVSPLLGKGIDDLEPYVKPIEDYVHKHKDSHKALTFYEDNYAYVVSALKPWNKRENSSFAMVKELKRVVEEIPSITAIPNTESTGLPGVRQSMRGGNISLILTSTRDYSSLYDEVEKFRDLLNKDGQLEYVSMDINFNDMGYKISVDSKKMEQLGLNINQISNAISIMFDKDSSLLFKKDGINYPIGIMGSKNVDDINEIYVVNSRGENISLGNVLTMSFEAKSSQIRHFNQLPSIKITAVKGKFSSITDAVDYLNIKAKENLPKDINYEFSGFVKRQAESNNTLLILFSLAILFIYAILAIQFESFVDPLIILFTVPLACTGALLVMSVFGQSLNIFTQIGLITLIGLITKHGILLVEFANKKYLEINSFYEAVKTSAILRFRPIVMTTAAMVFGAVPLLISSGAGSESRVAIGFVLIGGLVFGTIFTLLFVPSIYLFIKSIQYRK